jgi:hypothetical protein
MDDTAGSYLSRTNSTCCKPELWTLGRTLQWPHLCKCRKLSHVTNEMKPSRQCRGTEGTFRPVFAGMRIDSNTITPGGFHTLNGSEQHLPCGITSELYGQVNIEYSSIDCAVLYTVG